MTLEFRDHQILVISPGSSLMQAQMGLTESLMPPAFEVPTLVHEGADGRFSTGARAGARAVRPIVGGKIARMDALLYLLKAVYRSVTPRDGLPPAVYLVASLEWSRRELEQITQYLFEQVGVPALGVCLQGVAAAYAFGVADALVVDVGLDKTEITAVLALEASRDASRVVKAGGSTINANLAPRLPNLSADQIEDLKTSGIYEVVGADHRELGGDSALVDEDGVVDVAAIVASGRAREILSKREQKGAESEANADREQNQFVDRHGQEVTVGLERFVGTERLVAAIVDAVADVLYRLEPREQQRVFDSIVITGKGAAVPGLSQLIADKLDVRYVIRPPPSSAAAVAARNGAVVGTPADDAAPAQSPTSLSLAPFPGHFPEWKTRKWDDYVFLGAQIGAKQVLTTGVEGLFVGRQDYNEMGPASVWDTFN